MFEAGDSVEHLATVVGEACERLSAANIPHNLFVVDCGQRVFLFPNAFARAKAQGEVPEDLLDSQVRSSAQLGACLSSCYELPTERPSLRAPATHDVCFAACCVLA